VLITRIITALVLAPIAIGGVFLLDPRGFSLFTGVVITLGAWEWANMSGLVRQVHRVLYALAVVVLLFFLRDLPAMPVLWLALAWWLICFALVRSYPAGTHAWGSVPVRMLMGLPVLVPAWVGLNHMRTAGLYYGDADNNLLLILYVFCVVWVAKLAPRVSPGKSWAGVWGGLLAVAIFAAIISQLAGARWPDAVLLVLATLVTGGVSVLGDLLESMLKRFRGIKDSSGLLPGHGGIMDRIDSLTAAIPLFALMITLLGWLKTGYW
jgi:phosphatidate cytidylyltransferase